MLTHKYGNAIIRIKKGRMFGMVMAMNFYDK